MVARAVLTGAVLGVVGLVIAAHTTDLPPSLHRHLGFASTAALLGAMVGSAELVSRYRDEPLRAVGSDPGVTYLALNAAISGLVYGLLVRYGDAFVPGLVEDRLMTALAAGFGAMALVRSKFFIVRTEKGEDVPVGPDAALTAFLNAADRGVDRTRAARRLSIVTDRVGKIANPKVGPGFIKIALAALQNLGTEEKTTLIEDIEAMEKDESFSDVLKLQAIGYLVLSVTGEDAFNVLMDRLERYASDPAAEAPSGGEDRGPATS